jgi:hypothetical protein
MGAIIYEEKPEWYPLQHPWDLKPSGELDEHCVDLLYGWHASINKMIAQKLSQSSSKHNGDAR